MRCSAGYKKITGVYIGCVLIFLLLFPVVGHIGVTYCYAADPEQEQQKIKESILSEFEYGEIDDSLQSLFPEKRIIFKEVISEILTGNLKASAKLLSEFVREQMFYLLQTGKKNLIHILLIAMIAAFMNQFAGTLQNRQVASVGFYMIYMLLAALTVAAFDVVLKWVESGIRNITAFMGVFYPVYFLAVAVAKGSVTGVAFYNLVLFLIYAVEIIIGNVLLPMVHRPTRQGLIVSWEQRRVARIYGHNHKLRTIASGNLVNQIRRAQSRTVDAHLIGSSIEQTGGIVYRTNTTAYSKGNVNAVGYARNELRKGVAPFTCGTDVEIDQLVSSRASIVLAELYGIAYVLKVLKMYALHRATFFHVKARDNSFTKHGKGEYENVQRVTFCCTIKNKLTR